MDVSLAPRLDCRTSDSEELLERFAGVRDEQFERPLLISIDRDGIVEVVDDGP